MAEHTGRVIGKPGEVCLGAFGQRVQIRSHASWPQPPQRPADPLKHWRVRLELRRGGGEGEDISLLAAHEQELGEAERVASFTLDGEPVAQAQRRPCRQGHHRLLQRRDQLRHSAQLAHVAGAELGQRRGAREVVVQDVEVSHEGVLAANRRQVEGVEAHLRVGIPHGAGRPRLAGALHQALRSRHGRIDVDRVPAGGQGERQAVGSELVFRPAILRRRLARRRGAGPWGEGCGGCGRWRGCRLDAHAAAHDEHPGEDRQPPAPTMVAR